jgi:hypothetical protein
MLLEKAETEEEASYHFLLPSLFMSFMAFEAFVNFCGFVLLPEWWKEEKKHFRGKGIEGKLTVIVDNLPDFSWQKGQPPYQRIKQLETFRDIADFRSRKFTHNGQGQGYSKTTGRLRNHGMGRHPLSRAASRRMGLCARLSKRTTIRSACT